MASKSLLSLIYNAFFPGGVMVIQRRRLGLSHDEVATAAGLSLRTIQRLEKGESLPRGYTIYPSPR